MADTPSDPPQQETVFILQCRKCRLVVADSTAWVLTDTDIQAVPFKATTHHVTVDRKAERVSENAPDLDCAYVPSRCACGSIIGKMYTDTPYAYRDIQGLYIFDMDAVDYYELGSHTPSNAPAAASPLPYASKIAKETRQMKRLTICMIERLEAIEARLGMLPAQAPRQPLDDGAVTKRPRGA